MYLAKKKLERASKLPIEESMTPIRKYCKSKEDLKKCLHSYAEKCVFRGQTNHYISKSSEINISPSMVRKGCLPELMGKWTFYARDLLSLLSGQSFEDIPQEYADALLQHYGWRSWYVDVTNNYHVASWFASHKFTVKTVMTLVDDCFDNSVILGQQDARYVLSEAKGNIYVLSKSSLEQQNIGLVDLSEMETDNLETRIHKQNACLIGPRWSSIPEQCIVAHVTAPIRVLHALASEGGIQSQEDLFPTRDEDVILKLLLLVPWDHIPSEQNGSLFTRGLMLPEYDYRTEDPLLINTALYKPFWVIENRGLKELKLTDATFFRLPESAFHYYLSEENLQLEILTSLIKTKKTMVFESKGILAHAESTFNRWNEYEKGIVVHLLDQDLVEVSALNVDYQGIVCLGTGRSKGWHYRIHPKQGWQREHSEAECNCNKEFRHRQHLVNLMLFEKLLKQNEFRQINALDHHHYSLTKSDVNLRQIISQD